MEGKSSLPQDSQPEDELDIREPKNPFKGIIESLGEVKEWEPLKIELWEIEERRKETNMRAFLVYSTISLWGLWTIVALITLNPYLIFTSPPMLGLLWIVFKHYFN
jgi:hypothetical protein